jgi:hypothetical protein
VGSCVNYFNSNLTFEVQKQLRSATCYQRWERQGH